MNLLCDPLPSHVCVEGKRYEVYTDFRRWILFELTLLDPNLSLAQRTAKLLALGYRQLPPALGPALSALARFYGAGQERRGGVRRMGGAPVYRFDQDAPYIYAAFYQQYGIDLQQVKLHWFSFRALFLGLSEQTAFGRVLSVRSTEIASLPPSQRALYRRLKGRFRLEQGSEEGSVEKALSDFL